MSEAQKGYLSDHVNGEPMDREALEGVFGPEDVFDSEEFEEKFEALAFLTPYVAVRRKGDDAVGVLAFQPFPRFYFNFVKTP